MVYEFRLRRIRRACAREPDKPLYGAADAAACFRIFFRDEPREIFVVASLDVRNRVLGVERVAVGSLTGVEVHPREIFHAAIVAGAAAIVVGHNHPSGDAKPSPEDWALTERIRKCGELLGIPLLDHVIVTDDTHTSMAESWR